jgi:hypothetical protein
MKHLMLFENHASQKELEKLSTDILNRMTNRMCKWYLQNKEIAYSYISFGDIYDGDYHELRDFIKETNMKLQIHKEYFLNTDVYGTYLPTKKFIILKQKYNSDDFMLKLFDLFELNDINRKDLIKGLRKIVYRDYNTTLIHELQHAFDDYRSNGIAINFSDKEINDRVKLKSLLNKDVLTDEESGFMDTYHKNYMNLSYEIEARFTETVNQIDFSYIYKQEKNMYSFDEIFREFKSVFDGYDDLSKRDRRRVLHRLGKYYELEKDFIRKEIVKE